MRYMETLRAALHGWKEAGLIRGYYLRPNLDNNTVEISLVPAYEMTWKDCALKIHVEDKTEEDKGADSI